MSAEIGDRVRVQYTYLHNAETARPKTPKVLEFIVGAKHALPGLSDCVTGMQQGEQKRVTLQPAEAFGNVQPRLIREIPRECFRTKSALKVGMQLNARNAKSASKRKVRIVELKPDSVVVDGNHPCAGRPIRLEMFLVSIDSSSEANRSKPQFDNGGES
jgi:FKBP-type peptidyl-prolyl cis-trans isomerase SlyD